MARSIYYPNKRYYVWLGVPGGAMMEGTNITLDEDFGLVVAERPKVKPPEVRTEFVEILGRHGDLDLTGAVDGNVYFGPTEVEIKFIVMPDVDAQLILDLMIQHILGRELVIGLYEAGGKLDKPNYPLSNYDQFGLIGSDAHQLGRVISLEADSDEHSSYITMKFKYTGRGVTYDGLVPSYNNGYDEEIFGGSDWHKEFLEHISHRVHNQATFVRGENGED